jgi:hypothetical protein
MDFDLPDFDTRTGANRGIELQLRHLKTDEPTQRFITVLGKDSDAVRAAELEQQRRYMKLTRKKRGAELTPEEVETFTLQRLVAATAGWRGFKNKKDEEIPFSPGAAMELYRGFPGIRNQVAEAMDEDADFLQASSTS